jgi:hypothetical protein
MTDKRDFKSIVRDRQRKTGESYTTARAHVERERKRLFGIPDEPVATQAPIRVDAAVLKVGSSTARIRILGEEAQITLRAGGVSEIVPGQIVTVKIEKRWTFHGDPYASGRIERARIDIAALGLVPLPLDGGELEDLRASYVGRGAGARRAPHERIASPSHATLEASSSLDLDRARSASRARFVDVASRSSSRPRRDHAR